MKLFKYKSPLRLRIEKKIRELERQVIDETETRDDFKQTIDPKRYSHFTIIIMDIKQDIQLLKSLL